MEQRRHDRFPVLLKIRLDRGEGVVQDVSAGGISSSPMRLEIGQELIFHLEFPHALGGSIGPAAPRASSARKSRARSTALALRSAP